MDDATTGIWPWIGTNPGIAATGTKSIGFDGFVLAVGICRKLFGWRLIGKIFDWFVTIRFWINGSDGGFRNAIAVFSEQWHDVLHGSI